MLRVRRVKGVHQGLRGLALACVASYPFSMAKAADFEGYPYGGPVYQSTLDNGPAYQPAPDNEAVCRILLERRVDPYGREVVHRIRMCDEGPVYGLGRTAAPQDYRYDPRRYYYERSSSDYYSPRPPAPVGRPYYSY
jgi:hypothetical protein